MFTVHQKHERMRRIHACCIRVRGIILNVLNVYCSPKTREDAASTRTLYSGAGHCFKIFLMFTVHQKHELMLRIHARCIRVRGHFFNVLNVYCPPKTRDDAANTRAVYSGAGRAERSYFLYYPPKIRDGAANTRVVHSGARTRGEKLLSLLSTRNKR